MKHDAIVSQGIPIHERIPIPDALIPDDSRVEIDASEYLLDPCTPESDSIICGTRREGCATLNLVLFLYDLGHANTAGELEIHAGYCTTDSILPLRTHF